MGLVSILGTKQNKPKMQSSLPNDENYTDKDKMPEGIHDRQKSDGTSSHKKRQKLT